MEDRPVQRISLDVPLDDLEYMGRLARYNNATAKARGVRIKFQQSRKSLMEYWVAAQIAAARAALAPVETTLGPLPSARDRQAMADYVNAALK